MCIRDRPCVLYGGNEVVHFTVPNEGLRNLVYTPHIYVVDLIIDGKKVNAIQMCIRDSPCIDNPPNFRLTVRMTHH